MHEEAKKKLSDVLPENNFKMKTGEEIKNLHELLKTLKDMVQENFLYHVNNEKNDFAEWIRHSIGDTELADKLITIKDLESTKNIIEDRISFLKRRVEIGEIIKSIESFGQGTATTEKNDPKTTEVNSKTENIYEQHIAQVQTNIPAPNQASSSVPLEKNNVTKVNDHMPEHENTMGSPILEAMANIKNITENKNDITEDQNKTINHEMHPFEYFKKSLHLIIRDILIGFVIGMVVGLILGYYVW
jgi:hypothetical protein